MYASSNLTPESSNFRQLKLPWFTTVNDFAFHGKPGSGVNGLFSSSNKLQLIILHICFLFASDIKIIWRIKGKDLNRNDDLKTYLAICICVGAAALTSCQSPVCFICSRPRTFLQDRALSFWLLLKNSRTDMPNKIGKLCFGPIPTSLFGSKQKCEVKETSLFLAKWTSVHLNTQSAHLWFDPSHFLHDLSRLPVSAGCLWAPRTWRQASSSAEHHSTWATFLQSFWAIPQKFYFPQPTCPQSSHMVTTRHHHEHVPSALCLLHTSRGFQLYLKETMIFLHVPTQLLSCFLEWFPFCTSCRISWSKPLTRAAWDHSAAFFQEVHWERGMA